MTRVLRFIIGTTLVVAGLVSCGDGTTDLPDPYHCGPNDQDGDGDGRCNE